MALRVALTAAALRTSWSDDAGSVWDLIRSGESALQGVQGFDASGFEAQGAPSLQAAQIWTEAEGPEDDPTLRILGAHGRLLDAVARSVYDGDQLNSLPPERLGLFVGMGMVDSPIHDLAAAAIASRDDDGTLSLERFFSGGYRHIHPLWPLSMLGNVAAGQVSIDLNIRGDNLVLASDADAGLRALLEGARSVQRGDCDAAIVAGVSGRISPASLARRSFEERLAVASGEGGAALALRTESSAARGYVTGGATTFDPQGDSHGPSTETWARAIQGALAEATLHDEDIDVVFLHAEAGSCGDAEAVAAGAFRSATLIETKRALGHLGAGAPALDLALALEALRGGARSALLLAGSSQGGAGALVVEAS